MHFPSAVDRNTFQFSEPAEGLGQISPNLESGEANPSLAVLVKVASTLGVPIDELLAAPRAKVRKWTAEEIGSRQRGQGVAERPLVPEPTPEGLLYVMDFAPDARLGGTPHLPGTREYFTCLDGRVEIVVAGQRHDLEAGMFWPSQATLRIPTTTRIRGVRRAASRWSSWPRQGSDAASAPTNQL